MSEQAEPAPNPPNGPGDNAAGAGPALEALLRWYLAMGVDIPMGETARDCFARPADERADKSASPPPSRAAPSPAAREAVQPTSAEALVRQAHHLAAACATLEELAAAWAALPGCGLAATAGAMIFADGREGSRLMLVGGAPDTDDERQNTAFAGAKGRLLDRMLGAIGLARADVYLANVVPWRPPGNRLPTTLELQLCLPFARRQIALAAPAVLVCLGERAAQPLLDSREPVSKLRGRWLTYEGDDAVVRTLATYSLDYLLKQPLSKRRAWADLQMIAEALDPPS